MLDAPYDGNDFIVEVLTAEQRADNSDWRETHAQHADEDTNTAAWSPITGFIEAHTQPHRPILARPILTRAERKRISTTVDHVHEAIGGASVAAVALAVFAILALVYAPDWRVSMLGVGALLLGWAIWALRRASRTLDAILRRPGGDR